MCWFAVSFRWFGLLPPFILDLGSGCGIPMGIPQRSTMYQKGYVSVFADSFVRRASVFSPKYKRG